MFELFSKADIQNLGLLHFDREVKVRSGIPDATSYGGVIQSSRREVVYQSKRYDFSESAQ